MHGETIVSILLAASTELPDWWQAFRTLSVEDKLLPLLWQLALIILLARAFAVVFRRFGQPSVVGEIMAGLVLGPSVLGRFAPDVFQAIFHPQTPGVPAEVFDSFVGWGLTVLSEVGLIVLLFLIGLEFEWHHIRRQGRAALSISLAGILLPFALGCGLAQIMHAHVAAAIPELAFALFCGTALSITAIPVLGRIMMEMNITRTRLGAVTLAAAALDDAAGWILLAAVAAVARSELDPLRILWMIAWTIAFLLFMFLIARPLLRRGARLALRAGRGEIGVNALALLFVLLFGCALATNRIGIFAVFGAFCLGAALSGEHEFREAVGRRLRDVVTAFFLPIFFAYAGLRTDLNSLTSWPLWGMGGLVLLAGVAGKFGGCGLAARLGGLSLRESACVGALMNTRGLMSLIVINLGKDLGVLPDSVFCMMVLMALVTTAMTSPLLLLLMPGTELEAYIRNSGYLTRSWRPSPSRQSS
jgi:Kef-type K+ transport system membrane component KefB